jgi:hypothetical protein
MSLGMTIVMLISAWLAVAGAMLWGVMRIARRHHHPQQRDIAASKDAVAASHPHHHASAH